MDLERPHIGYRYRVRYRRFSFDIVVLAFDIEEWQEGWFWTQIWSVLISGNDVEDFPTISKEKTTISYPISYPISYSISYPILYTYISLVTLLMQVRHSGSNALKLVTAMTMWIVKWMITIYVIMTTSFFKISARHGHRRKDPFPNSWSICLARWTAHLLLMLDSQSNLLLMTGRILVKNTSPTHTSVRIQSRNGCQRNWLSGLGQIFAKN